MNSRKHSLILSLTAALLFMNSPAQSATPTALIVPPAQPLELPGSPLGIAWFILYGHMGVPAVTFMPPLRDLGAGFSKVYLFWQQIEPEKGHFDWTAPDAFVAQLHSPDEGLISLFSSSQWAVKHPSSLLPPSPAKDLKDYYNFVHATVSRYKGKVRYWQNDAEPNNPVFWSGSKEEFVAQLKVFYRAVKDADPAAQVVMGGYDGLFIPPNMVPLPGQRTEPFPQQKSGLEFFDYVLRESVGDYDLFDLRLYGDPYTITARVDYMRERMRAFGPVKPIICTEYGGPGLFEFPQNRAYIPLIQTWSQAVTTPDSKGVPQTDKHGANRITELYAHMSTLAPQTQMFMQGCSPELEAKYNRIQSRGVVMRNLLALSDGVQKTLYWELLAASGPRDDLMTLMYGKIGLISLENGQLKYHPTAEAYKRMAQNFAGIREVTRVLVEGQPSVFLFKVDRGSRSPLYVVWERRDAFFGEDAPAITTGWPWTGSKATATDTFGAKVPVSVAQGKLTLPVSLTPIYVEADNQ
ncbi:MAG TPA: hypothetical protein VGM64_15450 [Lacunisphaera sp.]|jgi:hypothetical protein